VTAPFAPPPSRAVIAVLIAMAAVAIVIPFGRRTDWLGWVAFLVLVAANGVLWGLLLRGFARNVRDWWRGRGDG
jgi:hypothetical protein